jgi:flagellar protein FlaI
LTDYKITSSGLEAAVKIVERPGDFVRRYELGLPEIGSGTKALMENVKTCLIEEVPLTVEKILDIKFIETLKEKFRVKAEECLAEQAPTLSEREKKTLIGLMINELVGLGKIEMLLSDGDLEEIVINSVREPLWVYHKSFGWLKTNFSIDSEEQIANFANIIGRRVGKQITILDPLLDAHLVTGDRANATLFPISSQGNTLTIRRFRREPWTATDFIKNKTLSSEVMALLWFAVQYEANILFSGGTASGKTTMLNVCLPFVQANHRIISIEETRELTLPSFLHWVPLTTREPSAEGKGGVSMLDLMINSLRMRPDRMVVGEVRRQREVEVLFEAMHTGHSGYTTIHANTAEQTVRRITTPPIALPVSLIDIVHLNVVMFRNRRTGERYVLEISEYIPEKRGLREESISPNALYKFKAAQNQVVKHNESIRFFEDMTLHTGFSFNEIKKDLAEKQKVLDWMVKQDIHKIDQVGRVIGDYYIEKDKLLGLVRKNAKPGFLK